MRKVIQPAAGMLLGFGLTVAAASEGTAQAQAKAHAHAHAHAQPAASAAPAAPAACKAGQRDDFTAAQLDRARWATVVRETPELKVADGSLVIPTSKTDLIWPGDPALTQNIVLQALPKGPFTATAKVALQARQGYQQAGLVIYGDDDNYTKLVLYAEGNNDPAARRIALMREEKGGIVSTGKTEKLGADFPDAVWVRLTSDGQTVRGAYSTDGTQFTDLPESKSKGTPAPVSVTFPDGQTPKIGLLAMAGSRGEPAVIDAKFDFFELCPAGGAAR